MKCNAEFSANSILQKRPTMLASFVKQSYLIIIECLFYDLKEELGLLVSLFCYAFFFLYYVVVKGIKLVFFISVGFIGNSAVF